MRWLAVVALALVVSVFEASGALLVFALLGLATEPDRVDLPVVGDLRELLPDMSQRELLTWAAAILAVFFLFRAVTFVVQAYLQHRVAQNAAGRLAVRLLGGYLRLPYEMHLRRSSAELIRNAYDSVQVLATEVLVPAARIISQMFIAFAIFGVLMVSAPVATLLAGAVLGPTVVLLLRVIQPWLKSLGRTREAMAQTSIQSLQQSLQGMRDIKVLGREGYFKRDFGVQRQALARAMYLRGAASDIPKVIMETTLILFILGFFAVTVVGGTASGEVLSVLGLFAYAALRLQPALNTVVHGLNSLRFATPAIDQLADDLTLIEASAAASTAGVSVAPLPFRDAIELRDVCFRYAGTETAVLRGVNITIAPGESIGLVGPTGGGKSTLVDITLGLLEPTSGRVTIDGVDLRDHVAAWQQNLGVVFQQVFLVDDSLRRNICLGLSDTEVDESRVAEAVQVAQLAAVVAALPDGLDTVVGERGVRLSGGQRQRVAIARAIYRDPSVIVFDEGTASLDTVTESQIIAALEAMRGRRTLITVAHRLATVRNCDRILLIADGQIAEAGNYDDLLARSAAFRAMAGAS
jgi:ATP-binding cassette subfamily C protein